jgi:ATP-dependent Clp endopeptidase proteolytic subunit ClpP
MGQLRRDDLDRFFDYDIHVPTRTLFMGFETDEYMAELTLKGLAMLEAVNEDPITIIMNNMGGDVYSGLGIYDAISTSRCYITIKAFGHAMSMGSWIFQAADKRIISPRSTMMLHYGTSQIDSPSSRREIDRLDKLMEDTYLSRIREVKPRYRRETLRSQMGNDWWIPALEAVKLGLADSIMEDTE